MTAISYAFLALLSAIAIAALGAWLYGELTRIINRAYQRLERKLNLFQGKVGR